jgi:LCP family protein required for cell wall assembly
VGEDYRGTYRAAARGPEPRGERSTRPAARTVTPGPRPPRPPRTRNAKVARGLSWVALGMAVLILGVAGVGYVLVKHYDGNISRISVFGKLTDHTTPAEAPHHAQNILLVGSDSRAGANGVGTGGSHLALGQRSDTIILAHLFGSSDKAMFVSFPRDSYVEIPPWTDPTSGATHPSRHDKINSALAEGGPSLLIATIENLTKIRVDHYVQIDFSGFKNMVNTLGGVDVCLRQNVDDIKSRLTLTAGRHHIDGNTALAFVRDRHSFAGGDIDRIKNQQQLIGSLIHKVLSSSTLSNPLKLNDFLNAATKSLSVDERLSLNDMKNIALRVRGFSSGGVLFTTIPISNPGGRRNGASVVLLDEAGDEALFAALRADRAPGSPEPKPSAAAGGGSPAAAPLTVRPGAIRVRVFNGSGVSGLGRKAFNDLGALGFATSGTPSNRGTGATTTTVYYGPSKADSARTLAAAIPGAVLQEDPGLSKTLEVVVGSTYSGAKAVTVTAPAAPPSTSTAPATSPTPAVKIRTAQDDPCAA